MKLLVLALSISTLGVCFGCTMSSDTNRPATVLLTSNHIALSATDSSKGVDAALDCGCPCKLQDMMVTGDTNVIRFNLEALRDVQSTHHIVATALPSSAKPGKSYTCTFSFLMHDPMEMGGMHDYTASVTATFMR